MGLNELKSRVLSKGEDFLRHRGNQRFPTPFITREEALELYHNPDIDELCDAADEIARRFAPKEVDSCSIVNARSGLCGEDCKWCAQSAGYKTGCNTYNIIEESEVMSAARHNEREGIARLSLVTSGRKVSGKDLDKFCQIYCKLKKDTGLYLCASMGLLGEAEMIKLREAGVKRYHCNMETSERYFSELCNTHSYEDKRKTISAAQQAGLEVCSGGIIGMGESVDDRIALAFELASLGVYSVPMNILNPIKGTPLEHTPLISEEEIIRTAAVWRFILPLQSIRFAGGRMRLSKKSMYRMMRGGINGVLMGDMLTTVSNDIATDRKMFAETGWKF